MERAVIRDGRWVREDEKPLDPVELHQIHTQLERIHAFTKGVTELTHNKVEILSNILHVSPEQERAIMKILKLSKSEIKSIL